MPRTRPNRTTGRSLRSLAVLLAVVSVLAGCARIPTSGPVHPGRSVGETPRAYVRIFGVPPAPGALPTEIIRGFLRAAADISDDRRVARSYLATRAQKEWLPEDSTVVFGSEAQLHLEVLDEDGRALDETPATATAVATTEATERAERAGPTGGGSATGTPVPIPSTGTRVMVRLSVPVVARVDGSGHYVVAAPGDTEVREFGLVGVAGQWRIDQVSDGVLLSRADFDDTFWDLPVYFADPTGGWLVPDVRWFPVSASTATTLVRAVLDGPPEWLAPGVTTGAPEGTRMTQPSVPVQDGVATVDLTSTALLADPVHRQMLKAQLRATLVGLPAVARVRIENVEITVESSRFDITSGPVVSASAGKPAEPGPRLVAEPVVDNRPVVIARGRLARLNGRTSVEVPGLSDLAVPGVSWPAAATDGSAYAVLAVSRLLSAGAGGNVVTLLEGKGGLVAPSFDPFGWVWTAQTATGGAVWAGRPDRSAVRVAVIDWPDGFTVTSVRLSRDGSRVLVGGRRGESALAFVCAVQRDAEQTPVRLGPPLTLLPDLRSVRSAAWVDQWHVVVLGRRGSGPEQPWNVEIGGGAVATAPVESAVNVTGGNGDIYLGTADGTVYRWAQSSWERVGAGAWPALPG